MIYEKLAMVQNQMKAPKSLFNSFGKYKYRNAESILEAFKPYGKKYGLALVLNDSIEMVGERYYIKAVATLYDTEDGSSLQAAAFAREAVSKKGMDDSQITGATSSYARKYCLNGLFLLDDTKDTDTDEFMIEAENRMNKTRESELQILKNLCKAHNVDISAWIRQNGKSSVDDLTVDDIGKMLRVIKDRFKEQ